MANPPTGDSSNHQNKNRPTEAEIKAARSEQPVKKFGEQNADPRKTEVESKKKGAS